MLLEGDRRRAKMQVGEETTEGEGIQAAGQDRFQEEGLALASDRAGREWKEAEKASSRLWAGLGRNPVPTEGRLNEFLVESINTMALLSPATFLNENQFINTMSPFPLLKARTWDRQPDTML